MRLGDIKNLMARRRYIKLMLQSKYELPGSSYVNSVVLLSPSLVVAPTAIVCGRCVAHLMGMVESSTGNGRTRLYKMSFILVYTRHNIKLSENNTQRL